MEVDEEVARELVETGDLTIIATSDRLV